MIKCCMCKQFYPAHELIKMDWVNTTRTRKLGSGKSKTYPCFKRARQASEDPGCTYPEVLPCDDQKDRETNRKGVDMTHADLVNRARRWLWSNQKCKLILTEFSTWGTEIPDAIGFNHKWSVLVECKISMSDFYCDRRKRLTRGRYTHQLGNYRYYLCPKGLIRPEQVPEKWGLLYCYPKQIRIVKSPLGYWSPRVYRKENFLLYSFGRRVMKVGFTQKELKEAERKFYGRDLQ